MAGGGRVALQAALGGLAGGLAGFQQAQARKKEEKRQQLIDAIAIIQAGGRPVRQPAAPATVSPELPPSTADVTGASFEPVNIPGLEGYEFGPTPAEQRAERQRKALVLEEQKKFERANRGRFSFLQRSGYIPPEVKYEDMGDQDLSPDVQSYLAGQAQQASMERTQATIAGRPEPRTSVVPVTKPDGTVVYMTPEQAVGQPIGSATPPRSRTAQELATEARLRTGVSEMQNADKNMRAFEDALISGQVRITASQQLLSTIAKSFSSDNPTVKVMSSLALAQLGRSNNPTDQQLYRYVRRGLSFAEGELMLSSRPSDYRTKMATFLSMASAGSNPDAVRDIQGRRGAILNPLVQLMPAEQAATTTTVPNPWRR